MLHRLRGCSIGADVFIGDQVYLENEFPELISIGDHTALAPRVMLIAHVGRTDRKAGPLCGQVIIGAHVFVGLGAIIAAGPETTLTVGDGAVVGAGCVLVNRSVRAHALVQPPPPQDVADVTVAFTSAGSYAEFLGGLVPHDP